jgi:ribosome-associated protein
VEGYTQAEWVLLDYVDFVLHVFSERARKFYDLERLWKSARKLSPSDLAKKPAAKKKAAAKKEAKPPGRKKSAAPRKAARTKPRTQSSRTKKKTRKSA